MKGYIVQVAVFLTCFSLANGAASMLFDGEECMSCAGSFNASTQEMTCIKRHCSLNCKLTVLQQPGQDPWLWSCSCLATGQENCELTVTRATGGSGFIYVCNGYCLQSGPCAGTYCVLIGGGSGGACHCLH